MARISPSFRRECSMAVQEAVGEKARQKLLGRRGRAWSTLPYCGASWAMKASSMEALRMRRQSPGWGGGGRVG